MMFINEINNIIYGYLLIYLLIFAGVYFTFKLRVVQIIKFRHMLKLMFNSRKTPKNQISSFQAFCTTLGGRVGSGNIAGVAVAISLGGAGAIFWMWVIALLGMATAFVEGTLAQLYKVRNSEGIFIGGPAYYISKGLNSKFWAIAFSICLILAFGLAFNAVQANTAVIALHRAFAIDKFSLALLMCFLSALVIVGGIKRVSKLSEFVVPLMTLLYLAIALVVISYKIEKIPVVFYNIFAGAFGLKATGSGILGSMFIAVENGVKRGLFSNEAGMGSAANAAATASPLPKNPVSQGYIQMFGVFVDTIVICTISALIILLSDVFEPNMEITGIELVQYSLASEIGDVAYGTIAIILIFFAFTSIISNYSYAESNIKFLTKRKLVQNLFRVLVVLMVFIGSLSNVELVWGYADVTMGMMAIINLTAIVLLSNKIFPIIKSYNNNLKKKESLEFKSKQYEAWH